MSKVWDSIYNFGVAHPLLALLVVGAYIAGVGSLKAPTADSSQVYKTLFAVLNFFSLQFKRMFPKVEDSPNFPAAVNLQQKIAGQEPTPVKVPPKVEDAPKP
jgi:hypothetical protein